jgi:hypothetical protein
MWIKIWQAFVDLFRSKYVFKAGDRIRLQASSMQTHESFLRDHPDLWGKKSLEVLEVIPVPHICTCGKDPGDGKLHEDLHDADCDIHQFIANRHQQRLVIKTGGKRLECSGFWFERI